MRSMAVILAVVLSANTIFGFVRPWRARGSDDVLSNTVAAIVAEDDGTEAVRDELEERLLALVKEHASEQDKGIIYASIAHMYSHGRKDPATNDDMGRQAVKYAKLALGEPLDPRTACSMYSLWGHATSKGRIGLPPAEFAAARRRTALLYLLGLKCALDNGAPAERQPVPSVGKYLVVAPEGSPELTAARERHRRQLQARRRADRLSELADYRYFFVIDCIFLYDKEPYDPEELRAFSEAILVGHEDVAAGIMRKLQWWQENKVGWQGPPPRDSDFPPDVRVGTDGTGRAPEEPVEGGAKGDEAPRPKG